MSGMQIFLNIRNAQLLPLKTLEGQVGDAEERGTLFEQIIQVQYHIFMVSPFSIFYQLLRRILSKLLNIYVILIFFGRQLPLPRTGIVPSRIRRVGTVTNFGYVQQQ